MATPTDAFAVKSDRRLPGVAAGEAVPTLSLLSTSSDSLCHLF